MTDTNGLSDHDQRQRALVLAQRDAFKRGVNAQKMGRVAAMTLQELDEAAKERYPMPRITRYRTFTHHDMEYRVKDNVLEYRWTNWEADTWKQATAAVDFYNGLQDLFKYPIERMPDE